MVYWSVRPLFLNFKGYPTFTSTACTNQLPLEIPPPTTVGILGPYPSLLVVYLVENELYIVVVGS